MSLAQTSARYRVYSLERQMAPKARQYISKGAPISWQVTESAKRQAECCPQPDLHEFTLPCKLAFDCRRQHHLVELHKFAQLCHWRHEQHWHHVVPGGPFFFACRPDNALRYCVATYAAAATMTANAKVPQTTAGMMMLHGGLRTAMHVKAFF